MRTSGLVRYWGLNYNFISECECYTTIKPDACGAAEATGAGGNVRPLMWHCNTHMWHGRLRQKTALIVSPSFHPLHVAFGCLAQSSSRSHGVACSLLDWLFYIACRQSWRKHKAWARQDTHASTVSQSISCKTLTEVVFKSALLTINSPCWNDYLQTVQKSQEKQSRHQHVGRGAQHCSLS